MKNAFLLLFVAALLTVIAACDGLLQGSCKFDVDCVEGDRFDPTYCRCVHLFDPDADTPRCPLPNGGACALGDTCPVPGECTTCTCSPDAELTCTNLCEVDASSPPTGGDDAGNTTCTVPGGAVCMGGSACVVGSCTDGTPVSCNCRPDGQLYDCTTCAADAGPPPGCFFQDVLSAGTSYCAPNASCFYGYCSDGAPINCLCVGMALTDCSTDCAP